MALFENPSKHTNILLQKTSQNKSIDVPLNSLLVQERKTRHLSEERKTQIREIARDITEGKVYVIDFGNVVGYVCDGSNLEAQQHIRDLKHIEDAKSHPFPLITTSSGFVSIANLEQSPADFAEHAKKHTLPQGVHFRIAAKDITDSKIGMKTSLPENCYSRDTRGKVVQIVIFNSMFPQAEYLIEELRSLGVEYLIATSANLHNEPETTNYRKGQSLAESATPSLPFFDATIDAHVEYMNGSYPGVDVDKQGLTLFRPGHFLPEHVDALLGKVITKGTAMKESRYTSVPLPEWLIKVVFSLPPAIQSPFLQACATQLDVLEQEKTETFAQTKEVYAM